ncbi:MAG: type I-C CRISPR-associated protein Cas5c [Kiritimatiellae bacterium]|nr:type I-C CRISPR-associated protein Cas5c [Kiritimatiellia bacterium]
MNNANCITLRVWGDFACFTRPEMKVERVSYPFITPSAARGIFEAIYWEPEMYYLIDTIHVIKRGSWFSTRRNEVTTVISMDNTKQWMKSPEKVSPICAGGGAADGTQRNMLALRDVEYLITAEIKLTKRADPKCCNIGKYLGQIKRRAVSGKCFHRPYLGVREFDACFDYETNPDNAFLRRKEELAATDTPLNLIKYEPIGLMLHDVFDHRLLEEGFKWLKPEDITAAREQFEQSLSGLKKGAKTKQLKEYDADPQRLFVGKKITPLPSFFQAEIVDNIVRCHPDDVSILIQDVEDK